MHEATILFACVYEGTWCTVNRLPHDGKRKTEMYEVRTKECEVIAQIKWYGPWRTYALFPKPEIVMEAQCMREIAEFLVTITREQRARKSRKKLAG